MKPCRPAVALRPPRKTCAAPPGLRSRPRPPVPEPPPAWRSDCRTARSRGRWLEHWLTTIAARRVRQRTLKSHESAVRQHLMPGIGRHRMDRLRPEHLDQLYTALLDAGHSPASVLRHHRILSRALTVAVQRGHVPRNVAAFVDPPPQRASDIATALELE
ncbi:hypothetical protein ACI79G_07840 [Geodermatophilus sp. SYSU D00779]